MSTLQMAAEQLKRERDAVELDLRANVGACRRHWPVESSASTSRDHISCDRGNYRCRLSSGS